MIAVALYRQTTSAFGLSVRAGPASARPAKTGPQSPGAPADTPAVILSRASHKESTSLTLYGPTGMTLGGLFDAARRPAAEQQELAKAHQAARDLDQRKAEADAQVDGLSQKIAEHTKKLAVDHINTLKEAARKARLLGLLDPKGAVAVAKSYGKQLAQAAREFGAANKSLTSLEDKQIARLQPDEETTITREVSVEVSHAEVRADREDLLQAAIDAVTQAIGGLDHEALLTGPAESEEAPELDAEPSAGSEADEIEVSALAVQVTEDISITSIVDTTKVDEKAAAIMEGRLDRLEGDAEVIKEAILALRELKTIMVVAAKEAAKRGAIDKEFRKEFKEAKEQFADAIVAVAEAAMPVIEAGFSIEPDEDAA